MSILSNYKSKFEKLPIFSRNLKMVNQKIYVSYFSVTNKTTLFQNDDEKMNDLICNAKDVNNSLLGKSLIFTRVFLIFKERRFIFRIIMIFCILNNQKKCQRIFLKSWILNSWKSQKNLNQCLKKELKYLSPFFIICDLLVDKKSKRERIISCNGWT